jgi:hypothetical protein
MFTPTQPTTFFSCGGMTPFLWGRLSILTPFLWGSRSVFVGESLRFCGGVTPFLWDIPSAIYYKPICYDECKLYKLFKILKLAVILAVFY